MASSTPCVVNESAVVFFNEPDKLRSTLLAGRIVLSFDLNAWRSDFNVRSTGKSSLSRSCPWLESVPRELSMSSFCNFTKWSVASACNSTLGTVIFWISSPFSLSDWYCQFVPKTLGMCISKGKFTAFKLPKKAGVSVCSICAQSTGLAGSFFSGWGVFGWVWETVEKSTSESVVGSRVRPDSLFKLTALWNDEKVILLWSSFISKSVTATFFTCTETGKWIFSIGLLSVCFSSEGGMTLVSMAIFGCVKLRSSTIISPDSKRAKFSCKRVLGRATSTPVVWKRKFSKTKPSCKPPLTCSIDKLSSILSASWISARCPLSKESAVTKPKTGTKMTALPTHKILRQVFFFLMGCMVWLSGCFSCSDIVIP